MIIAYRLLLLSLLVGLASPVWAQRLQSEYPQDTALAPASMMVVTGCEAKDQDGAALPRAVSTEGDAVRCAATLSGIQYQMIVNEDGSLLLHQVEDAAHASGQLGIMPLGVRNDTHTTAFSGTDGDYTPLGVDSTGKLGIRGTFAEDAAHTSADLGQMHLCVRNDAGTALAGTDLDYIPCATDSTGAGWVRDRASLADDSAFTVATSLVQGHGAMFDDVVPDSVDEGDIGIVRMSANRNLYTTIRDAAGSERGLNVDANNEIGVGAIRTSVTPGTAAANLGKAEDAAHTTGDVGVMGLAVRNDTRGTLTGLDLEYAPLQLNSNGDLRVDLASITNVVPQLDNTNTLRVSIFGTNTGNGDTSITVRGASADATGNAQNKLYVDTFNKIYNGTDWDRTRAVVNSLDSVGTGIAATGLVAQLDETSPSTVTENQFSTIRLSSRRALHVEAVGTQITLQASQVSAIVNGTTTRTTTTGLAGFRDLAILINITGAGVVTGTLQLFLQDSQDGGTTWDDIVASNTFVFGAATTTQRFFISGRIATTATQGSAVANETLVAGTVRNGPWGDRLRVREVITGIGGTPTGVTYAISAVPK